MRVLLRFRGVPVASLNTKHLFLLHHLPVLLLLFLC